MSISKNSKKDKLKEVEDMTQNIVHHYYCGDLTPWMEALHKDCIWMGSGEPTLIGADSIKAHFSKYKDMPHPTIIYEAYTPISLSSTSFLVSGQVTLGSNENTPSAVCQLTMGFRFAGNEAKILYQHLSYDFITQPDTNIPTESKDINNRILPMDISSRLFIRQLLLNKQIVAPIAITAGNQTYFVNPNTIIYLQSNGHRTNVVCIDRTLDSSMLITEISSMLGEGFYAIRRGSVINTMYVTTIRRCEVEMLYGTVIKIPVPSYVAVKQDLQNMILKQKF